MLTVAARRLWMFPVRGCVTRGIAGGMSKGMLRKGFQKMIKRLTDEQIAEAKKNGQAVIYGELDGELDGELVPMRILSKEETLEADANWDDEMHCPKGVAALLRKVRERTSQTKQQ